MRDAARSTILEIVVLIAVSIVAMPTLVAGQSEGSTKNKSSPSSATKRSPDPIVETARLTVGTRRPAAVSVVDIGAGRSRLEYVLEEGPVPFDKDRSVSIGDLEVRNWFLTSFVRRNGRLAPVQILERIDARTGLAGTRVTRKRVLEATGAHADVAKAADLLRQCAAHHERDVLADIVVYEVAADDDLPLSPVRSISGAETEKLVARLEKVQGKLTARSTLRFPSGHESSLRKQNELAYIKDYRMHEVGGRSVADPVVDKVREGILVRLGAMILPDGKSVAVAFDLEVSKIRRPIANLSTTLDDGTVLRLQIPERAVKTFRSSDLELNADRPTFVVWGRRPHPDPTQKPTDIVLVGRVRIEATTTTSGASATTPRDAEVIAYDAAQRLAVVRNVGTKRFKVGNAVVFRRAGREVGRGTVIEVGTGVTSVKVEKGASRAGDRVTR